MIQTAGYARFLWRRVEIEPCAGILAEAIPQRYAAMCVLYGVLSFESVYRDRSGRWTSPDTHILGRIREHVRVNRAHKIQHRLAHVLLEYGFARVKPVAVVMLLQCSKKVMPSAGNPGKALAAIFIIRAMSLVEETYQQLHALPELTVLKDALLSRYTRFGIGGPAILTPKRKTLTLSFRR